MREKNACQLVYELFQDIIVRSGECRPLEGMCWKSQGDTSCADHRAHFVHLFGLEIGSVPSFKADKLQM